MSDTSGLPYWQLRPRSGTAAWLGLGFCLNRHSKPTVKAPRETLQTSLKISSLLPPIVREIEQLRLRSVLWLPLLAKVSVMAPQAQVCDQNHNSASPAAHSAAMSALSSSLAS